MERKGEGVGERGGGLPVMSSYCRPPKLLIRKSAIYRLLRRDRTEGSAAWAGARKMDESAAPLQTPESIKSKKMYLC